MKQRTGKSLFSGNRAWVLVIPSFLGISAFYFIPALVSLIHSFTDAQGHFVWFENFTNTLSNTAFLLAARNTLFFIAASVPLSMLIAFILAAFSRNLRSKKAFTVVFMLPLIIPSGPMVFFWKNLFSDNGLINRILLERGIAPTYWLATPWAFVIVLVVFLFKYIGFNYVLFLSGFHLIPKEYYEVAKAEGAGVFQIFRHVTFIYMLPTTFLVLIMSIINSFKIFREIYLLFGPYPQNTTYMLQHYMNNQFVASNLQRLSVTATVLSVVVLVLVLGLFTAQRKASGEVQLGRGKR